MEARTTKIVTKIVEADFAKVLHKITSRKDNIELVEMIQTHAVKIGNKHMECLDMGIENMETDEFIYTTRHTVCAKRIYVAFKKRKERREH